MGPSSTFPALTLGWGDLNYMSWPADLKDQGGAIVVTTTSHSMWTGSVSGQRQILLLVCPPHDDGKAQQQLLETCKGMIQPLPIDAPKNNNATEPMEVSK
jgi:hypothetical protein